MPYEAGIHKIRHVIVVMQENRSFDSYFGTYPGADGIPMRHGHPTVCVPDPELGRCVRPFHDPRQVSGHGGLRNSEEAAKKDINRGAMNGFLRYPKHCPACVPSKPFALGYKNASDIPLYWKLAHRYVLQDHMFESSLAWSLPSHLYMVSAWSAACHNANPWSCRRIPEIPRPSSGPFAWTDITYLLARHTSAGATTSPRSGRRLPVQNHCKLRADVAATDPTIWNPLPRFSTVRPDHQLGDIRTTGKFFKQAAAGHLPAVSWVIPNSVTSEHPPGTTTAGQHWVAPSDRRRDAEPRLEELGDLRLWDDWAGSTTTSLPPTSTARATACASRAGRQPYARRGYVDHQVLSFDAYRSSSKTTSSSTPPRPDHRRPP